MRDLLTRWIRILAIAWPRMLAWYLLGEVVRSAVIQVAAPLAGTSKVLAMLLVPIAILARLIAYLGMFLAARDAMSAYRVVQGAAESARGIRERAREFAEVATSAIIPFFVVYDLIGGVADDLSSYATQAFRNNALAGDGSQFALDVGQGPGVLIVFLVALVLRLILQRFGSKLPEPFALLDIYLDAVWVFVAVNGVNSLLGPVLVWWQNRSIVAGVEQVTGELEQLWSGFRYSQVAIDVIVPLAAQLLLLPLAWAVIAAVVYTRSVAELRAADGLAHRVERRLAVYQRTLPPVIRDVVAVVRDEWDEKVPPAVVAIRLILRTGAVTALTFLGTAALLYAARQWLARGLVLAVGAHPLGFWIAVAPAVAVIAGAVIEPVRISLLAAFVDRGMERVLAVRGVAATREQLSDAAPEGPEEDRVSEVEEQVEEREEAYEAASDPAAPPR